ncbi:MAG: GntR family transcriptional regulator [Eubacteriales bacterium]|nr:GntR family transcriptional regulator [Eubacteriales bacterium]
MTALTGSSAIHGSLRNRVYTQLRDLIISGTYSRGTALTEIRVSQELGVSRTPVREAFSQLQLDGLVIATPNKGIVVEGLDQADLLDWYEIRITMESMAAQKATKNLTPELAAELMETISQAKTLLSQGQFEDLLKLDARFHDLIFKASGSRVLKNFLSPIAHYTRQSRQVSLTRQSRAEAVINEHTGILNAMLDHNPELARQQMQTHISHAAESYRLMIADTSLAKYPQQEEQR